MQMDKDEILEELKKVYSLLSDVDASNDIEDVYLAFKKVENILIKEGKLHEPG